MFRLIYWRRIKLTLGNQYYATIAELPTAIWSALETIPSPGIYQYLCP